jgi:hypothetical protein
MFRPKVSRRGGVISLQCTNTCCQLRLLRLPSPVHAAASPSITTIISFSMRHDFDHSGSPSSSLQLPAAESQAALSSRVRSQGGMELANSHSMRHLGSGHGPVLPAAEFRADRFLHLQIATSCIARSREASSAFSPSPNPLAHQLTKSSGAHYVAWSPLPPPDEK